MSRAADTLIAGVVRSHRFVFISSTALLAIGTSRIADKGGEWASWLLILGAATTMYVADLCGDVELKARELARSTSRPLVKTRVDVFRSESPRWAFIMLLLGSLVLLVGFTSSALG